MRILVTGAAGFIGSTLVDRLLADGHEVIGVDDLSTGRLANLELARDVNDSRPGAFSFTTLDVRDPSLADVISAAAPDAICHLAAQIDVRVSVQDPMRDASANVLGTINVLEAARRAGVKKVVFTSSGGSIYGTPHSLPVAESAPVAPESPYAAGKAASELYLKAFSAMYGLETVSLALANVFGPRQDPHGEAGVVAIFGTAMLEGKPTKIFGDGSTSRDYVYVGDVADAFAKAVVLGAAAGLRVNIGTGTETYITELHSLVAEAAGAPDTPVFDTPRVGELQRIALDCALAESELGWTPQTSLKEGLAATVAWIRSTLGDIPGH